MQWEHMSLDMLWPSVAQGGGGEVLPAHILQDGGGASVVVLLVDPANALYRAADLAMQTTYLQARVSSLACALARNRLRTASRTSLRANKQKIAPNVA